MINEARQFFLNRFKTRALFAAFCIFLCSQAQAGPCISILGESTTTPALGSTMYVTISLEDDLNYNDNPDTRPEVMAAIISGGGHTALDATCNTAGQYFVIDNKVTGAGNIASGPNEYDQTAGATGVNTAAVYTGLSTSSPGGSCAANAAGAAVITWPIYIDSAYLAGGTYSFVTAVAEDYYTCANAASSTAAFNFSIPLPATGCTLADTAGSATAAPGSLILYTFNYSFVNATSYTLTTAVPANTTVSSISPGGTLSAGTITWIPYTGSAANTITGTAWVMLSVNAGATGTITDAAAGAAYNSTTTTTSTCNSPSANVTVQDPTLTLNKSESATSAAAGSPITYTLGWLASGLNLDYYDSYDNDTDGSTTGTGLGYDGTGYTRYLAQNGTDLGQWAVTTDVQGNNYIVGTSAVTNTAGSDFDYPALIRNGPGVNICGGFTVQGDLQIPGGLGAIGSAGDCAMVVAVNASQGLTMSAAISGNSQPAYFYFQKNQNYNTDVYAGGTGAPQGTDNLPSFPTSGGSPIIPGNWYTVNVNVQFSGAGPITYTATLWPTGVPADAATFVYIDPNDATDYTLIAGKPNNPVTISGCSCGWSQGWQTYETTGIDYFRNLQVYSGGPVSNYSITDAIPPGITYVSASVPPSTGAPGPLVWNFPVSSIDECPVTWWGTVGCTALPINNSFSMTASNVTSSPVTSNTVNLAISGGCNTATNTATSSPTSTPTATATSTVTNTPTATPTNTGTPTQVITSTFTNTATSTITQTPTNTPTLTPTSTSTTTPPPTSTWTPSPTATPGLYAWPNPFNPKFGNGNFMVGFVQANTTVDFYTVSGELVRHLTAQSSGDIYWDGTNKVYMPVSTGIYIYIVKNDAGAVILSGKVLLTRN